MKVNRLLVLAAVALALTGCSSTPTKVDSGPIRARTFSFADRGLKPEPTYTDNRQAVHRMIQEAITKNLADRGVTKADTGGDVTVGYLVIIGDNATTTSINDYFGEDAYALQVKAHEAYTASKNPNYFQAGTLVIDIIDSKSFKVLKRGYATRPILRKVPDDARAARIQEVVDEILRDVRIAQ
jgi:uncharacterized protein DUF4136